MDEETVEKMADAFGFNRADGSPPDADSSGGKPAALYSCEECDRVYIGGARDSCGDCGGALNRVPNGRDLGIVDDR